MRKHQQLFECLEGNEAVGHAKTRRFIAAIFCQLLFISRYNVPFDRFQDQNEMRAEV
jgi:hypothetical protein